MRGRCITLRAEIICGLIGIISVSKKSLDEIAEKGETGRMDVPEGEVTIEFIFIIECEKYFARVIRIR